MKKNFDDLTCLVLVLSTDIDLNIKKQLAIKLIPILGEFPKFLCNHPGHIYSDVFDHTLASLKILDTYINVEDNFSDFDISIMRIVLLMHDTGKMTTRSVDKKGLTHFYDHPHASAIITRKIIDEYNVDNKVKEQIINLVREHDNYLNCSDDTALINMINTIGLKETKMLFKIQRADLNTHAQFYIDKKSPILDKLEEMYNNNQA